MKENNVDSPETDRIQPFNFFLLLLCQCGPQNEKIQALVQFVVLLGQDAFSSSLNTQQMERRRGAQSQSVRGREKFSPSMIGTQSCTCRK